MRPGTRRIPSIGIFGEAPEVTTTFVHAERIQSRAPSHDWEISVHRHAHLAQALAVTQGGGVLRVDAIEQPFEAPWLVWIPTGAVHAYSFTPGTDGIVVSVSADVLETVIGGESNAARPGRDAEAARLREAAESIFAGPMPRVEQIDLNAGAVLEALAREAAGELPGSGSAVTALLRLLLVGLLRSRARQAGAPHAAAARAEIHRRFRRLVEAHLREAWPIARFAKALAVTTDRLHAACTEAVGKAPQAILHDRLMLEARRNLIHTRLSVSEIAFDLGFRDPAYFSRFFAARAGMSPAAYRRLGDPERGA
ncbi:helix-turn-helix domain-containing protein [Falsiroseomonas sp. HW251]|uniref:helix-turn-helix domain-containing protein n=1 Tax=Falsiroseomonas sp. HW251 TaxID=3390998 RepID=UPI003D31639C